ncbi:MAG: hypothetical protein MZV64_58175 [Ignavibacteriales bacterium]|nr:hypothetical protein [Ignavibacteriales bacterium]
MAEKKKFLLRIDENIHAALEKWAADDLRSINAQIGIFVTDAIKKSEEYISKIQYRKMTIQNRTQKIRTVKYSISTYPH